MTYALRYSLLGLTLLLAGCAVNSEKVKRLKDSKTIEFTNKRSSKLLPTLTRKQDIAVTA